MIGDRVLFSPAGSFTPATARSGAASPKKRRLWKILAIAGVGLVVTVGGLVLLAPTIASSMAPARVESAVNAKIKGRVQVDAVDVGWGSATSIGPLTLFDPDGKPVAKVQISTPTTLWRIVSERWWSLSTIDAGTITAAGVVDVVRSPDGSTNLQRAIEPRQSAATTAPKKDTKPSGTSSGLERIKATVNITDFDLSYMERDASGATRQEMGLKDLKGGVALNYAAAGGGAVTSKAELTATPTGAAATGASEPLKISLDADVSNLSGSSPSWPLPDVRTLKANLSNLPIMLADALAGMNGALVRDVGPRADLAIDATILPSNAKAKVSLVSEGAKADLDIVTRDGAVVANGGPGANGLALRSTEFLDAAPGLKDTIAKMARQVRLSKAPSVEVALESLRWPLPAAGGKTDLSTTDLRGSGALVRVRVSQMAGTVSIDGGTPGREGGAPAATRSFSVEPIELVVSAQDLSQPVTITGGTRTTIDNAPGGEISLRAVASGLLDANGRLRALDPAKKSGLAENVDAQLALRNVSTALLQPLIAGANLPLDLPADVGPTLEVNLVAKADVKRLGAADGAPGALPPVDASVNVQSANIKADAALRVADNIVALTGNGLTVQIASAGGLAQRMLAGAPGKPAPVELSGPGAMTVNIREFSAPLDKLKGADALAAIRTQVAVDIANLNVLPKLAAAAPAPSTPGAAPAPAGPAAQPVQVSRLAMTVKLDGANPPTLDLSGAMSHEGQPFELAGNARLDGIVGGKLPQSPGGMAQLVAFKPTARFELKNVPRSILNLVPGASSYGTTPLAAADMPAQISRAVRESIGGAMSISLSTQPASGTAQDAVLKLTSAAGGLSADANASVTPTSATLSRFETSVAMDPRTVNPVLQTAASSSAQGGPAGPPIQLAQPFRLMLKTTQPVSVPLKADASGATSLDLASASDLALTLATDNDIAIENVPTGTDEQGRARTTGLRVRNLRADVKAPLSGLAAGADAPAASGKRLSATFGALAARSGDNAVIADISGSASATMSGGAPEAVVKIAGIDTAVAENLIGQPGLLSGALGEKAEANLRVQPQGSGPAATTLITADLTAPRLSEAKLNLMMDQTKIALTQASTITWRPDAAFINSRLLAGKAPEPATPSAIDRARRGLDRVRNAAAGAPADPAEISLAQAAPITIRLTKFAIAKSQEANGQPTVGPLKPGIFELQAAIDAPSIGLLTPGPADGPEAGKPRLLTLEGVRVNASQELNAPTLLLEVGIDKVQGADASGAGGKKSGARVQVANLADQRGVLTTDRAVLNLDADLVSFPTPVIDRLANQNGLLAELLGPVVTVNAVGRNVSAAANAPAGNLEVTLSSPRATAQLKGDIRQGTFVQTGPIGFTILEIRPQLIELLGGTLPVIGTMEKKRDDQPAAIDARNMQIPVDGDLRKLNGALTIDPGVARFQTKSIFGELVEALGGNAVGSIGNRLQPFTVTFTNGVAAYDKFELPVGSFNLSTKGTVDLVNKRIDVVTYVPLFALSQKAIGAFDTGLAGKLGVIDRNTLVPITTRGSLQDPKTEVNVGLFMQETGDRLFKEPGKVIENVIGDILGGGRNKPAPPPKNP